MAITITTYREENGEIIDADMLFNMYDFEWISGYDAVLRNVMTHEFGHLLGLGHSDIEEATMHGSSEPGEISKETLDEDDINGINELYPHREESIVEYINIEDAGIPDSSKNGLSVPYEPMGCSIGYNNNINGLWLILFLFIILLIMRKYNK